MIDKNQKCQAHFKGIDGQGTCDTECDWYNKDCPCNTENFGKVPFTKILNRDE